jgi:hypothetical protein
MVTEESRSFERAEQLLNTMTSDVVESLIMSGVIKDTLIAAERAENLIRARLGEALKGVRMAFDQEDNAKSQ